MKLSSARRQAAEPLNLSCLVVEDQTMFLQLLVGMLRTVRGIEVCGTAKTVAEAARTVRAERFDVLILDLKLSDGDGLDVLRVAADAHPHIDCIVLSSKAGEFSCPQGLLKNLRALVDKTQAFDQLQAALAAVVQSRGVEVRSTPAVPDAATILRPRELQIFRLIGKGLKTAEIGRLLNISKNTVETHRKSIAAKLGASGAELVRIATLYNQTSLLG
jgi:DNA-binding NarL/FixJ family response regulator